MADITGQTFTQILVNEGDPGISQPDDQLLISRDVIGVPTNFVMTQQELLNYNLGVAGAVNQTFSSKLQTSVSFTDFGAVGDGITDDTLAYVKLMAYVNLVQNNLIVYFPPGRYLFAPNYSVNFEWRTLVECVDVSNITFCGYGAVLVQNIPNTWVVGDPANHGNEEGPVQFRSSTNSLLCSNIKILGLNVQMVKLTYSPTYGDGAAFSFAFRGVSNGVMRDVVGLNASTDNIYIGTVYANGAYSKNISLENVVCDNSLRNNVSVVGCNGFSINNYYLSNASGGSFCFGIDFEPDYGIQSGMSIGAGTFYNNSFGSVSFIRTKNVSANSSRLIEPNTTGAIKIDGNTTFTVTNAANNGSGLVRLTLSAVSDLATGDQVACSGVAGVPAANGKFTITVINPTTIDLQGTVFSGSFTASTGQIGRITENIIFNNCTVITSTAIIFVNGSNIDNVKITNSYLETTGNVNNAATFRIAPFTSYNIGTFEFSNNNIVGNGGIYWGGGGSGAVSLSGLTPDCNFKNNNWLVTKNGAASASWGLNSALYGNLNIQNNQITIDGTMSLGTYTPEVINGLFSGNTCTSSSNSVVKIQDYGAGRNIIIGTNVFSTYFYYQGVVAALSIFAKGTVQIPGFTGDFSVPYRQVGGGRQRVLGYAATPSVFINQQAPLNGDITYNLANNSIGAPQTSYTFITGLGWRVNSWITYKNSTASRPTLGVADQGLQYLDTTLAAAGELITWNGTAWVNSSGTIV